MLDSLFKPGSIAIIGASNRKLTIGYRILQNLVDIEFKGPLYPVHPKEGYIKNFKAYPSIMDIPDTVDLAHIVVKNTLVPKILDECGRKGVKTVIINTAGFKEIGSEGAELESEIVELGKKHGIRIFGPNCQGVMNTDPGVRLYANFTFTRIKPGAISIFAQSGGVGEVMINRLTELGVGIRMYASNGNACDISISEILHYWSEDPATRVIVLHIESLANPGEFLEVASKVTINKPVLAMKSGKTWEGAQAIGSHTGALMEKDTTTGLIFDEAGIVEFQDTEEMCQASIAFSEQPLPRGNRVGIITNTGGPGIIATDKVIDNGLTLPSLSSDTSRFLKENLFPEASINNPVDVLATAGPKQYRSAVEALVKDPNIDSLIVNFITPFFVDCEGVAREIVDVVSGAEIPVITVLMTEKNNWVETIRIVRNARIPAYDYPEMASKVMSAMYKAWQYSQRDREPGPRYQLQDDVIDQVLDRVTGFGHDGMLPAVQAFQVMEAAGIPVASYGVAKTFDELKLQAEKIGYPVAVKADSPSIIHKTELKAVVLNIKDEESLTNVYNDFREQFGNEEFLFFVQEYIPLGTEIVIGAKRIHNLGHAIMFGMGGIFVELMKDVSFGLTPLTKNRVDLMVESIKGYKILSGARGREKIDLDYVKEILFRTSALVTRFPRINDIDMNPIKVFPEKEKFKVIDARVKVGMNKPGNRDS